MNLFLGLSVFLMISPVFGVDPQVSRVCPRDAVTTVGDYYFKVYRGICYLFITYDHVTYDSALRKCQQHDGTLAMPKTQDVNDFLLYQMNRLTETDAMWIGMHDKAEEGKMVWEDGSAVEWDNFDWGVHGWFGGREDCIALDPDDEKWHDFTCARPWVPGLSTSHNKPFICQYGL